MPTPLFFTGRGHFAILTLREQTLLSSSIFVVRAGTVAHSASLGASPIIHQPKYAPGLQFTNKSLGPCGWIRILGMRIGTLSRMRINFVYIHITSVYLY